MKITIELTEEKAQEIVNKAMEDWVIRELEFHLMDAMSEKIWERIDPQIDIFVKSDKFVALVTTALEEIQPMIIKGIQKRFSGDY